MSKDRLYSYSAQDDLNVDTGLAMARKVFASKGNHSEVHLNEGELAGMLGAAFAAGRALPAGPTREVKEWHDRLGSMIDQVGHPDYSLRGLVDDLRQIRDEMLAARAATGGGS